MYSMLTQEQAQRFAQAAQTTTDNILKEHYQIYVLDRLFGASFAEQLIFKGGTALRLAYGSFRFSEDLDFSVQSEIDFKSFSVTVNQMPQIFPEAFVKEVYNKSHTLFAKVMFGVSFKPQALGIKIEINKDKKKIEQTVALLKSPFNNLGITGRVYTLGQIVDDKIKLLDIRREPRDLFDIWYINQKLGRVFNVGEKYKYTQKELLDNLNPFIPERERRVLSLFKK